MAYQILIQDSFCFTGCLPEGCGPESNGDTFENEKEALVVAELYLNAVFGEELRLNGDSSTVNTVWDTCLAELREWGETSFSFPWRDEETGEPARGGNRFVSVIIHDLELDK